MGNRFFLLILLIGVLFFSWQSCEKSNDNEYNAWLRIYLTDATSFTIREMHVDISGIEVYIVDTVSNEGEWHPIDFSRRTFNIMTLLNGKTVKLVDQNMPSGAKLQQVKMHFGDNNHILTNIDSTINLHLPDELLDGLVIDAMDVELLSNTISSMILDVNVSGSIVESDNKFYLYPQVRAFPETYGGKLLGYVTPMEGANPYVVITQGEESYFTYPEIETIGSTTGKFQFIGLHEGEWEVHVIARPESGYADSTVVSTVTAGTTTTVTPNPIRLIQPATE